jgi:hypothetical protein
VKQNQTIVCGGFLYLAADACPTLKVPVASADQASALFQQYRDRYCLGASDLNEDCGALYAVDGRLVARVSYNGRVWNPLGELLQEAVHGPDNRSHH